MPPSKVELYAAIRRDARAGMSGRAIEKKYRVGRRIIVSAMASAWPEPRKQPPPRASKLDPFKPAIDEILKADLDAPRKQRHTITRIYRRLMDEHRTAWADTIILDILMPRNYRCRQRSTESPRTTGRDAMTTGWQAQPPLPCSWVPDNGYGAHGSPAVPVWLFAPCSNHGLGGVAAGTAGA